MPSASRPAAPISCSAATSSSPAREGAGLGQARQTHMVVNTAEVMPGDFTRKADFSLPTERLKRAIRADAGRTDAFRRRHASPNALFGNSIAANMFLVGYAFQHGAVAASAAARSSRRSSSTARRWR